MKDDDNFIYKYYAPFLSSNNHKDISSESYYDPEDISLWLFDDKNGA